MYWSLGDILHFTLPKRALSHLSLHTWSLLDVCSYSVPQEMPFKVQIGWINIHKWMFHIHLMLCINSNKAFYCYKIWYWGNTNMSPWSQGDFMIQSESIEVIHSKNPMSDRQRQWDSYMQCLRSPASVLMRCTEQVTIIVNSRLQHLVPVSRWLLSLWAYSSGCSLQALRASVLNLSSVICWV